MSEDTAAIGEERVKVLYIAGFFSVDELRYI